MRRPISIWCWASLWIAIAVIATAIWFTRKDIAELRRLLEQRPVKEIYNHGNPER